MLAERAASNMKRSAWCIEKIMATLREEFDASELEGAKEKVQNYIAKAALNFKRIKSLTHDDWLAMGGEVTKKNEDLKCELEILAESWRHALYGVLWVDARIKGKPTPEELAHVRERLAQAKAKATQSAI